MVFRKFFFGVTIDQKSKNETFFWGVEVFFLPKKIAQKK